MRFWGDFCRYSLEVTTMDETFYMFADSEKEKDEWIGAIGRFISWKALIRRAIVHSSIKDSDSD